MSDDRPFQVKGYEVSPELFTLGYSGGNHPCKCTSKCCGNGVYVDVKERDVVLAHAEEIKQQMDETQIRDESQWFESEERVDADYPSGKCVGTTVKKSGGCVLLDKRGWCSIQVASTVAGEHKWAHKPMYCVLFPIEVIGNVIRFDRRDHAGCCSVQAEFELPLFEACRDELVYLVGEDGYAALQVHYEASYPPPTAAAAKPGHLRVVS